MFVDLGSWKTLAVRGMAALLFGLLTLAWPAMTLFALVLLFGAYVLVNGAFLLISTLKGEQDAESRLGLLVLEGSVGVVIGILTFVWPEITALALLYLIATWAVVTGVLEIASAIRLRKHISNEWLLGAAGALSVLFGLILVVMPGAGALAVTWLIGIYATVLGVLLTALAFKLRRLEMPAQGGSAPLGV